MKRENLSSIISFVYGVNNVQHSSISYCNGHTIGRYQLGPCDLDIAKDKDLSPDTVATAIARRYYEDGGDLSDTEAVIMEIQSRLADVARRYPGAFVLRAGYSGEAALTPMAPGEFEDSPDIYMYLPVMTGNLPENIEVGANFTGRYNRDTDAGIDISELAAPIFIAPSDDGIKDMSIDVIYTPPLNYKDIKIDRVLCNRDNMFSTFFTHAFFYAEIYKYFLTKCLAPIYKIILDSKYVPDEAKEAIVHFRYKVIEVIDGFGDFLLNDENILNILKNISEDNEGYANIKLKSILDDKYAERRDLLEKRRSFGKTPKTHPDKDWDFINLTDSHRSKIDELIEELDTAVPFLYAGQRIPKTKGTTFRDKILTDFLYDDKPVTADEVQGIRAMQLARSVLTLLSEIGDTVGVRWLFNDMYSPMSGRFRKGYYDRNLRVFEIDRELILEALSAGSLDIAELQKEINKIVAKCKLLQPKTKFAANVDTRGPFYSFVDTIGGAYDTTGMGEPEHAKKLKKILQNAAKQIATFAGTAEKATPGDTVSYAMRTVADDESKLDAIYDIVDRAVNACYDTVFGASEPESED